jgi:ATP-binding cassette subfamily F protein 3
VFASILVFQAFYFGSGQLRIPSHISILHVEQEVVGDETAALESVLQCDTVLCQLQEREKQLNALLNA